VIFTVVWKKSAEDELAVLWVAHPQSRADLTNAANQIDTLLRRDPHLLGDPHTELTRILLVPPLGVIFQIAEPDRLVRVLAVWFIPPYTSNGAG
jgi:hypothetical protein